jgi:hypothetical protein
MRIRYAFKGKKSCPECLSVNFAARPLCQRPPKGQLHTARSTARVAAWWYSRDRIWPQNTPCHSKLRPCEAAALASIAISSSSRNRASNPTSES